MIPFRTTATASVSLGRRRGTTSGSGGILSSRALFLLAALCASIFTMGLLLGTHVIVVKKSPTTTTTKDEEHHVPLRGLDKFPSPQENNIKQTKNPLKNIIAQSQVEGKAEKLDDAADAQIDDEPEENEEENEENEEENEEENDEEEIDNYSEEEHLKELQKKEHEIEENLPEFKEQEEKEMEEHLKQHAENLKNKMPDIINEEVNEEEHPHLRNPYKQKEEIHIRAPDLNDITASDYYLFSTNSADKHIESATVNFASENAYDGVSFSTWIYLNKMDMGYDNSRTILSTPTLTCKSEEGKSSFIGWNLYVNSPNTNDQQLILQYGTYKHMNNQAYPTCSTLAASGYQIPVEKWTFISVTSHPTSGIKLYMNGEVIAEDKHSDLYRSTSHESETKTVLGLNSQNALSLEGYMSMALMFSKIDMLDKDVILLYEAGIDLSLVKATGTLLQQRYSSSTHYLYPLLKDYDTLSLKEEYWDNGGSVQGPPSTHDSPIVKKLDDPEKYKEEEIKFKEEMEKYIPLGGGRYADYKNGDNVFVPLNMVKKEASDELARIRRHHIRNAMKHAWEGYRKYAWGYDELHPQSNHGQNNWGGMGTTLVDSLDTLWLMGMKDEFWEARDWVRDHLTCSRTGSVSVFETTIRSLGGLLSAYDWSGDKVFLEKAEDLGQRLFHAVEDSPSGLPYGQTQLNGHRSNNAGWLGGAVLLAEVGTIQVEFRYLSEVMHKKVYAEKVNKVFDILSNMRSIDGLFPYEININGPTFRNSVLTFGAMADSFYEYLLKCWLQGGKKETKYREMYDKAMDGVHNQLLFTSKPDGLTYIADKSGGNVNHKMDHLACFMAGSLALGAYTNPNGLHSSKAQRDLKTGKALAYTCYQMYARMKTGISPEAVQFSKHGEDISPIPNAPFYILRPETLESFFILNYLTGDPTYREWGWEVFKSIEKYCRTDTAYGGIKNVNRDSGAPENRMESFFLAETLKYAYLLQDPDTEVDILNKHVFNTEAHPTRIFPELKKAGVI